MRGLPDILVRSLNVVLCSCGVVFSEWAARCPSCGAPTGAAISMVPTIGESPDEGSGQTVGALPVPDGVVPAEVVTEGRRRVRQDPRWAVVAGSILVVVAWVAVWTAWPRPIETPSGKLVAFSPSGVVLARPDAAAPVPTSGATVSDDARYAFDDSNDRVSIFRIGPNGKAQQVRLIMFPGAGSGWRATDFADHDQALVIVSNQLATGQLQRWALAPIGASSKRELAITPIPVGVFDGVIGDPRDQGVIAVGATFDAATFAIRDVDVEIRDTGKPPVVLASASQLTAALGLAASADTGLRVVIDPAGDKIAVTVGSRAVAVLNRQGHMIAGQVMGNDGLIDLPTWSPDGRSLVYATLSSGLDYSVHIWTIGRASKIRYRTTVIAAPGFTTGGSCLWAANDTGVLCETSTGPADQWIVANPAGGPTRVITADLDPLAWIP